VLMKQNDEPQISQGSGADISWNEGKSCRGSVWPRANGMFHFVPDHGQSLDGCPTEGAILRVSGPLNTSKLYEILGFELSTFTNARDVRVRQLPEPKEAYIGICTSSCTWSQSYALSICFG